MTPGVKRGTKVSPDAVVFIGHDEMFDHPLWMVPVEGTGFWGQGVVSL